MVTKHDMTGHLTNYPIIMALALLREQYLQGNKVDIEIFQKNINACRVDGGFDYNKTRAGRVFYTVIYNAKQPHKGGFFNNLNML